MTWVRGLSKLMEARNEGLAREEKEKARTLVKHPGGMS